MGVTPPRVHAPTSLEGMLAAALLGDDPEAVRSARERLVKSVDAWLWKHARGWWIGAGMKGELADYHGAAVVEAWKSVLKFDPSRGIKFISYVTRVLRFGLSRTARNEAANGVHTPQKHGVVHYPTMHFSAVLIPDGDTAVDFGATVAGRPETPAPPAPEDVWATVRRALRGHRFARRWEETLWLRYGVGATLDEIARRFGVTKEAVRQWLKGAMEELRERKAVFEDVW